MSNRNGTVRTSLYLSDDWHDWLKEMARIRNVPMQTIICQALALWGERSKDEVETKVEKLERERAEMDKRLDALEAAAVKAQARLDAISDGGEDADAAHRAKIKGMKVEKAPDDKPASKASEAA